MPVIRPTNRGKPLAYLREPLINALARELTGESTHDGPVIFEMPTGRDSEIDVIIIWDTWRAIPPGERSSIIHAAYQRHACDIEKALNSIQRDPTLIQVPKIVIGVTKEESLSTGLLPFGVIPNVRSGEADPAVLRSLMLEAGGIESPAGIQLRFPTSQLAVDAHDFLMSQMPEAHWSIVEEPDFHNSW